MAELKTKKTASSAKAFLEAIPDKQRRDDCLMIAAMMEKAAKAPAKMWGSSIVGFGEYHYKYASGREGDWMLIGFSTTNGSPAATLLSRKVLVVPAE